jgi:dipeptidyl-peptidase-4
MITLDTGLDDLLVGPNAGEPPEVAWGLAEFVAAEELNRDRGSWWSPDGASLLVERYDESAVQTWYLSEPADPDRPPVLTRYPRAGTANAVVGLAVVTPGAGRVEVDWRSDVPLDGCTLEYLADVEWSGARPVLTLLTRDQRRMEYRELDPATGRTALLRAVTDEAWVELLPGTPRRLDGRLLHSVDRDETRRIWLDDEPVTPPDVLVREVVSVADESVLAEIVPAIGSVGLARLHFDGRVEVLSDPSGVASGAAANSTLVVSQQWPDTLDVITEVFRGGLSAGTVRFVAAKSPIIARPRTWQVGPRGLPATVLFPTGRVPGSGRLPVLMDPYGGPHGQRVLNAARSYLTPQWFADQGFVVIVADGRGMAGRGPVWDRLAKNDRIGAIDDQVEVLADVAREYRDDLDLTRVAIRGWSFGGYLAALGVLRHPDVFAAAVAGAPTTDERLYDTCYSERYLGHPDTNADVYDANSLLPLAPTLHRPLLIIHGFADDNVHVAHSLRLSRALLAAGRPHEVLPLSGTTHLANDEVVAENLLLLQLDFLRRALRIAPKASRLR